MGDIAIPSTESMFVQSPLQSASSVKLELQENPDQEWRLRIGVGRALATGTILTVGLLLILRNSPDWPAREPLFLVAVIGLPIATALNIWFIYFLAGRQVVSITLTSDGISLLRKRADPITVKWSSSKSAFTVSIRGIKSPPVKHFVIWTGLLLPATGITPESAAVLVRAARMGGLTVSETDIGFGKQRQHLIRVRQP